uniref:Uncharacterized protein n=1 Tax=Tanacetum cinerariifolium TaxID=118510 RepID=A0A699L5F5_TANCI|nr:hypothetical protein [Tanacetum cinerariifolium]
MKQSFLSQKRSGAGRGVKEKDMVMVSLYVMKEHVDATVNTRDVYAGQTPTSLIVNPKPSTSYVNLFTTGLSRKAMNLRTLYTLGGNGVDVVVHSLLILYMDSFWENVWLTSLLLTMLRTLEDGLSAIATKLDTLLMLDSYTFDMCIQSWGRSSYARAMIEVRANVELKDIIMVAMPKLSREGFHTFGCSEELEKASQATRGVSVGRKFGFKPAKEYRPVSKKPTANTGGNKKKCVEPTKAVSNSNLFDVLNSVKNDGELGTVDKIGKLEKLVMDGKVTLVDDDGKLLKNVDYLGDHDSKDEIESVDNGMAHSMSSESVSLGTKNLLEQWRVSY